MEAESGPQLTAARKQGPEPYKCREPDSASTLNAPKADSCPEPPEEPSPGRHLGFAETLTGEPVKPTQTSDLQNCEVSAVSATKLVVICYTATVSEH